MNTITKAALGALTLASVGVLTAAPANAQASFGFSFGSGPYYGGAYYADPCLRPYRFQPAYCYRGLDYRYYYGRPYYRPYAYYRYRDYRRGWDRWRR